PRFARHRAFSLRRLQRRQRRRRDGEPDRRDETAWPRVPMRPRLAQGLLGRPFRPELPRQCRAPRPRSDRQPERIEPMIDKKHERHAENCKPFGEVIYSYTRAQAIADGVLVDVSETAKEAGFKYPVALTRMVFDAYVT